MNTTHVTSIFKTINFCSLVLHLIFRAPQMGLHKDINPMLLMKAKDTESFTITSLGHHTLWSSQLSGRIPCRTSFIWILAAMNTRHLVAKRPKMFPARPELTHKLLIIAVWSITGSVGKHQRPFMEAFFLWIRFVKGRFFFHTICQCGWIQACLYLLPCMHVCKHSWHACAVTLRRERKEESCTSIIVV